MLAVVKTPPIEVRGEIPENLMEFLRNNFEHVEIKDDEEEAVNFRETEWFKELDKTRHPGLSVKTYRENRGWTQQELGEQLGGVHRQMISEIERGKREISKKMAIKFSRLFNRPVERFLDLPPHGPPLD